MRQRPDQPLRRSERQFCVGIQGNNISNAREHRYVTCFYGETVEPPEEQVVKVHQLAPLPLPAHPASFRGVISSMTVQMQKTASLVWRILLVELLNQSGADPHQLIMFVKRLGVI